MCNVCVADQALAATACGNDKCVAFRDGYEIAWRDAPMTKAPKKKVTKGKAVMVNLESVRPFQPAVYVRARGKGSECQPAEYQIRLGGRSWPKKWTKTKDLAGDMGMYGLDVCWDIVPQIVRDWAQRKRETMPTLKEIEAARPKFTRTPKIAHGKHVSFRSKKKPQTLQLQPLRVKTAK